MPSFGEYVGERVVAETPLGAVYAARRGGSDGTARFAVKVFRPDPLVWEAGAGESGAGDAGAFLASTDVQRRAASAGPNVLAVHAAGRLAGGGAYAASDLCPASAQAWVEARRAVGPGELRAVALGVLTGIEQLRSAAGRHHGNLKPSNVLFAPAGDGSAGDGSGATGRPTAR